MRIIILLFLVLLMEVFAKKYASNVPLPDTQIMNLSISPCSKVCVDELRKNDKIFHLLSLSKFNDKDYVEAKKILNLVPRLHFAYDKIGSAPNKIAILLPSKKIKRYAQTVVNSIIAYAMPRDISFDIRVYDSRTENLFDLKKELVNITNDGYDKVIAILTLDGAKKIADIVPQKMTMFIPTVNKKSIGIDFSNLDNVLFGGVDYESQLKLLVEQCKENIKVINYNNRLAKKLGAIVSRLTNGKSTNYTFKDSDNKLENFIKNNNFKDSCLILNTPVVKSSVLMSAFTYYDQEPKMVLSTEINYHNLILTSTMYRDRRHMVIATSKKPINNVYYENVKILSGNIKYNWVSYSAVIATDYFISKILKTKREFSNKIVDNQVVYDIELISPTKNNFTELVITDKLGTNSKKKGNK